MCFTRSQALFEKKKHILFCFKSVRKNYKLNEISYIFHQLEVTSANCFLAGSLLFLSRN